MYFYTHLLHLLQPSVLWLSIVTFMIQSHRQSEFCANLMYHESDRRLEGSLHLSCKRDQMKIRDYMARRVTPTKWAITTPTRGPPPPCKQALKNCIHAAFQTLFINRPYSISFSLPDAGEVLFLGVKFQRSLSKFRKRNKNRFLMFRYSIEREIRTFHVVVVQRHGK